MVSRESLYFESLTPEQVSKERPLLAYEMVRGMLKHNQAFLDGEEPMDESGEPLYVTYKSEDQIMTLVTQAYGDQSGILDAIQAAYTQHYKELLERS